MGAALFHVPQSLYIVHFADVVRCWKWRGCCLQVPAIWGGGNSYLIWLALLLGPASLTAAHVRSLQVKALRTFQVSIQRSSSYRVLGTQRVVHTSDTQHTGLVPLTFTVAMAIWGPMADQKSLSCRIVGNGSIHYQSKGAKRVLRLIRILLGRCFT